MVQHIAGLAANTAGPKTRSPVHHWSRLSAGTAAQCWSGDHFLDPQYQLSVSRLAMTLLQLEIVLTNDCRNRIAGLKLDHTDEKDTLRHKDSSRSIILNWSKSLEKHTDRIEHWADSALYSAAKYSVHCQCLRTYVHFLVGWLLQSDAPMAFCGSASRYQEQCDRSISPVYLSPERWSLLLCYQSLETTWQLYCQCSIANLVLLVPYWQPAAMIASMRIACLIFIQHSLRSGAYHCATNLSRPRDSYIASVVLPIWYC